MPTNIVDEVVKQKGRLSYIEPNDFPEYVINKEFGTDTKLDNVSWDPEDLQYSVDLQVVMPDRYNVDCSVKNNPNTTIINGKTWVSFMEGSTLGIDGDNEKENYLTDAYTEISFQEYRNNGVSQKESLGIDSIEINFDAHFFPLVSIKFTDVRAAALFGPQEYEYLQTQRAISITKDNDLSEKEKQERLAKLDKATGSFFKALFRFPYPRFMLSIMGFYGDKVTFQLAVNDFKTNFNSQNGNFDVTVSFIGYMYGLYTDIPMSIIMMAPYYNTAFWDEKKNDGTFRYNDKGNDGNSILTFVEFLEKYYKMYEEINENENANQIKEYKYICAKKTKLLNILEIYENFEKQFTEPSDSKAKYVPDDKNNPYTDATQLLLISNSNKMPVSSNLYDKLRESVDEYNKNYNDDGNLININVLNKCANLSEIVFNTIECNTILPQDKNTPLGKQITELNEGTNSLVKKSDGVYKYGYYYIFDRGNVKKDLNDRIDKINKQVEEIKTNADNVMNDIMQSKLTFNPTIENIYRMIFAHIETFINSFNSLVNNIGKKASERTCQNLGLKPQNSDVPYGTNRANTFVPPFPLCKDNRGEIRYPGTFFELPQINNIDEVGYVNQIVEGIDEFTTKLNEATNRINDIINEKTYSFTPISHVDIFYNRNNPYVTLKKRLKDEQDDKTKSELIKYFFFSRFIMDTISEGIMSKDKTNELFEKEYKYFEEADIVINNNIKQLLKDNFEFNVTNENFLYNGDIVKNNLLKEPYCYYTNNPFIKDDINNIETNSSMIDIINNMEKIDELKTLENNSELEIVNQDFYRQWGGNSEGTGVDEYSLSYVLSDEKERKTRNDIGFVGDLKNGENQLEFLKATSDNNQGIENYHAGFLQIGSVDKSDTTVNNLYLGNTKNEIGVINSQENNYFKSFLFLGSICSYYGNFGSIVQLVANSATIQSSAGATYQTTYSVNPNALILKYPKMLLLYLGACIYFTENGFDDIVLDTKTYPFLSGCVKLENITDSNYGKNTCNFKTYTSKRHIFLDSSKWQESVNLKTILGFDTDDFKKTVKQYFIVWANSEFKNIDDIFKNTGDNEKTRITIKKEGKKHYEEYHNDNITIFEWVKNSRQDGELKRLLCEDVYVFYQPSGPKNIANKKYAEEFLKNKFTNIETEEDKKEKEQKNRDENEKDKSEQKKAMYYTLKTLYDKWLSSYKLNNEPFSLQRPSVDLESRQNRFNPITIQNGNKYDSEFNNFIFVDSFYRDISDKFLVNPTTVCDIIKSYGESNIMKSQTSVFEFMNEIAEKNNLLFVSLPVYNNLYSADGLLKMFTPNRKYNSLGNIGNNETTSIQGNTYMLMYTGEASSKLNIGEEYGYQDDGIDIHDIFDVAESKIPSELTDLFIKKEDGSTDYTIPAFGVTYARQNQIYFKNVSVNMDNPKVTDYSIANLIQISYGGKHGDLDSYNVGVGQDIYSIYSNRSYTCTVEMMGCLNIMPMMYFQLNNIPMFRGIYIIINVSHSVQPGNVTTRFTGVRVSKNHIGDVKMIFDYQSLFEKLDNTGSDLKLKQGNSVSDCSQIYSNLDLNQTIGTKNMFKLSDFISSTTAKNNNICNLPIEGDDTITLDELISRLNDMTKNILEPLQEAWMSKTGSKFIINSGYRNNSTNRAVYNKKKGEKVNNNSAHCYGYAVDLLPEELKRRSEFKAFVYYWLLDNEIKFDQFIDETNGNPQVSGWVHLGYKLNDGKQRAYSGNKDANGKPIIDWNQIKWTMTGGSPYTLISKNNFEWVTNNYEKYA